MSNTKIVPNAAGLAKTINFFGNKANLARALGFHPSMITFWGTGARGMTAECAHKIELLTHEAVIREELLPEIFDRSWSTQKQQQDKHHG
jgi:DNA-binding transcriptional regulator YdaS (Cro superfamily)